jgi:DNA-binding NtrC family response regulator
MASGLYMDERHEPALASRARAHERTGPCSVDKGNASARTDRLACGIEGPLALVSAQGAAIPLGLRTLTIGRDRRADLALADRAVSLRHATVHAVDGGWEIRDEGSTNGTWVDGVRVRSARLRPGLEIVVGRSVIGCGLVGPPAPRLAGLGAREPQEAGVSAAELSALSGSSEGMRALRRECAVAAQTPYAVLIRGESGTGKELVAQSIHRAGAVARGAFIAINAGSIPESLVESELFGHERGAFTGASGRRRGAFELADGGVLFLDEVGELPLAQQARLLRVLETGELRRVGAESARSVAVKFVCATHRDLEAMVLEGTFRADLLWRIAQHTLRVPPLRERLEDLPALCVELCGRISRELGRPVRAGASAVARLLRYEWPGNVRELLAVLRAAASRTDAHRLEGDHLGDFESRGRALVSAPASASEPRPIRVSPTERAAPMPDGASLLRMLEQAGSLAALARMTGRSRSALRARVQRVMAAREAPDGVRDGTREAEDAVP